MTDNEGAGGDEDPANGGEPTRLGAEPPEVGERAPDFEALVCDGETFRAAHLSDAAGDRGCVLVFYAFAFSAVAENWWGRYDRRGWDEFPVPVLGVCRDGPYAQNAFLRSIDSPFRSFSDTAGDAIGAYGLLTDREGMDGARTAHRAVFVLDGDRRVAGRWVMDDWISPIPADRVEEAVEEL
ncbi:peroxiredoxin [Halobacteriales archaeon QS_8_69_26]|nr:MAG: peroxiredoxin [Halobacteriales archaeon QS_8_69_26]